MPVLYLFAAIIILAVVIASLCIYEITTFSFNATRDKIIRYSFGLVVILYLWVMIAGFSAFETVTVIATPKERTVYIAEINGEEIQVVPENQNIPVVRVHVSSPNSLGIDFSDAPLFKKLEQAR